MKREEAITVLGDRNILLFGMSKEERKYYSEALDMAISALSTDGEYIKKSELFDKTVRRNSIWNEVTNSEGKGLEEIVNDLPTYSFPDSAENNGEWIDISTGKGIFKNRSVKCSVCGNTLDLDGVNCGRGDANFCPNCGSDMRGKE